MERFERLGDGRVRVTLHEAELELLRSIPTELKELYDDSTGADPVRSRLFPRAYLDPTAEDAEREWRELVHPELVRERLAALAILTASLKGVTGGSRDVVTADLTEEDTAAWLGVLNDARLALGIRLEVTEGTEYDDLDPDDPATPGLAAYAWLTYLQGELIETVMLDLPDDGSTD
jgi:hypothetical protein